MEISALAVKCRFCGESVGRPRDETRNLTIDDLGGETIQHYAPSSSVMEAMEAFRSETEFNANPSVETPAPKRSIFGIGGKKRRAGDTDPPTASAPGIPQLDERSKALASIALPTPRRPAQRTVTQEPSWMRRVAWFAAFVAAILILYFGGGQVVAYISRPPEVPDRQFRNPAESMLANDADPLQTLQAAVDALNREDHPKNREVLEKAHDRVVEQINRLLLAEPWNEEDLARESDIANRAFKAYPTNDLAKLKEEADADSFSYRMLLKDIQGGTAVFQLNPRSVQGDTAPTVEVRKGDTIQGRFKVVSVRGTKVQVQDTLRNNRPLTYTVGSTSVSSP